MAENPNGNGSPRAAAPLSIFEQRKKGRTVLDDIALEVTGYADSHRQQFCDEMSALFERYVVRVERELPELATFVHPVKDACFQFTYLPHDKGPTVLVSKRSSANFT